MKSHCFDEVDESDIKWSTNTDSPLNVLFMEKEISGAIKKLKNGKACGLNSILNEFIKAGSELLLRVITQLFNPVLPTGIFPEQWLLGIIKPEHKKGPKDNPSNFRGITILSCMSKLYTAALNKRLTDFADELDLLNWNQAGFRTEHSTLDQIFNLKSIIDLYLSSNKKLYCCFVDFEKAFDKVDRRSLWIKLLQYGISGRCFRVIYNMYQSIRSCVQKGNLISDFFISEVGLRQGENLSPLLFAFFINDMEDLLFLHG